MTIKEGAKFDVETVKDLYHKADKLMKQAEKLGIIEISFKSD